MGLLLRGGALMSNSGNCSQETVRNAAPDMLLMLEHILEHWMPKGHDTRHPDAVIAEIDALIILIAKAKGIRSENTVK